MVMVLYLNSMPGFHKNHPGSLRSWYWDYSKPGFYFITMCVLNRGHLFGVIENGKLKGNPFSDIVRAVWDALPASYQNIRLDEFVIMPEHVHFVIEIVGEHERGGYHYRADHQYRAAHPICESPIGAGHRGRPRIHESWVPSGKPHVPEGGDMMDSIIDDMKRELSWRVNNPWAKSRRKMLIPKIIGRFKMQSAKAINLLRGFQGNKVWQADYYERVVRDNGELARIRQYIQENPKKWEEKSDF
ncbi:MAG: transposase [Fibrobacteria bacterium]|nr:transposase [Fibrobacteria bacterium]